MKILVTGGAGFIGGNFVHFMLKEHPQDDILWTLTYAGNMETLAPVMGQSAFSSSSRRILPIERRFTAFLSRKNRKSLSTLQRRATLTARLKKSVYFPADERDGYAGAARRLP